MSLRHRPVPEDTGFRLDRLCVALALIGAVLGCDMLVGTVTHRLGQVHRHLHAAVAQAEQSGMTVEIVRDGKVQTLPVAALLERLGRAINR